VLIAQFDAFSKRRLIVRSRGGSIRRNRRRGGVSVEVEVVSMKDFFSVGDKNTEDVDSGDDKKRFFPVGVSMRKASALKFWNRQNKKSENDSV
jgi:hypothetical protein